MDLFANIPKKERGVNFSKQEMDRLQTLISKHQYILFCKKTDNISSSQKESAWKLIEAEFNALGDTPRTVKQLKYKFENLKRDAKKGATKERQEMRRTGGGPPLPPPGPDDATEWLRSIIPMAVDGNPAVYDDDVIFSQNIISPTIHQKKEEEIKDCFDKENLKPGNEAEENKVEEYNFNVVESQPRNTIPAVETTPTKTSTPKHDFDASTPYSSLKRPVSSPIKRQIKKRKPADNYNPVRQMLREKKLSVMDQLQELELQKIRESIRHAQEIQEQTLRHSEEWHKLEIEKLNLEIAVLKKYLEM